MPAAAIVVASSVPTSAWPVYLRADATDGSGDAPFNSSPLVGVSQ